MKSPFYFIVKPMKGKRYDNTKSIGGIDFIVSTSEEDHRFSNRYAEVIETPLRYSGPIQVGDTLLVHHNVFKFYNDMRGRQKSGKSFFKDDIFLIEPDQFFMYKHQDNWYAYDKYCFVEPIPAEDFYLKKNISKERFNQVLDIYLKILDSTRADIPTDLQDYWIQNQDRLSLKGKFLPDNSNLVKYKI